MNSPKSFILVFAILLLAGCAHHPKEAAPDPHNASRAERRILVTFADRSINRAPLGDITSHYRKRGNYRSSTWSKRTAAGLAEAYGLKEITGWPITTLGVYCAVYEIPENQSVEQVMDRLSKDERVEVVQKMHLFRTLKEGYSDPYFNLQAGLRSMEITAAHRWATGHNVTVAVVDSGVDIHHPDLSGQVVQAQDFVVDTPSLGDGDIHGTAVAGIIAALADNGQGIVGIAPRRGRRGCLHVVSE